MLSLTDLKMDVLVTVNEIALVAIANNNKVSNFILLRLSLIIVLLCLRLKVESRKARFLKLLYLNNRIHNKKSTEVLRFWWLV